MSTVYVVVGPDGANVFSKQADAEAYAARENNLAKQRGPQTHQHQHWRALPGVEIDAKTR